MNQPKKPVLRLLDIDPDRVYFLPKTLEPVKIVCTDASGWQRGRVRVDLEYQKLRLGTEQFHLQNRLAEVTAHLKVLESL